MTDIGGGETILGCPFASFTSLEAACSITNLPPCAQATSVNYNEACCGSLSSFALSLATCFSEHAPSCLDTSAVQASLTGGSGPEETNPCAAYFGNGGAGGGGSAPSTTAAPAAPSSTAAAGGSGETTPAPTSGGAAGSSAPGATDTAATPSPTASKSGSQRQQVVGASLKVYIGVALVGALAVISL